MVGKILKKEMRLMSNSNNNGKGGDLRERQNNTLKVFESFS